MKAISGLAQGAILLTFATPAFAQITADDVWTNQTAYIQALGLQVAGTQTRDGQVLTVSGIELTYLLPMNIGSVFLRTGDVTFTENADGTVAIGYAPVSQLSIGVNAFETSGTASADFTVTLNDYVSTASGTPGDITYDTHAGMMDFALDNIAMTPDNIGNYDLTAFITIQNINSSSQIAVGDVVRIATESSTGATVYDIQYSDEFGSSGTVVGSVAGSTGTGAIVLPLVPMDLMNLSVALRNGLSLDLSSAANDTVSHTIVTSYEEVISDQRQNVETTTSTLSLGEYGLRAESASNGIIYEMRQDYALPVPVTATVSGVTFMMHMPVLASTDTQPIGFGFYLRDLAINDELWSVADPNGVFERTPGSVGITVEGEVLSSIDVFDFMAFPQLEQRFMSDEMPIELRNLSLSLFQVDALGVNANGEAAFTFDNTDLTTYNGLPRPVGTGSVVVTGTNAFLDKLIQIGILSSEDLSGVRMGIAMFAEATGPDELTATGEMTADGQIIVNGQRMQ